MYVKGQGAKNRSVLLCLEYFFLWKYFIFHFHTAIFDMSKSGAMPRRGWWAGHGGDFCHGSQWWAAARCTPLCKWCPLHLQAGLKGFYKARAENTPAGAGRGVGGVKQESSRTQDKRNPQNWEVLIRHEILELCIVLNRRYCCVTSWSLPSMSPLKRTP